MKLWKPKAMTVRQDELAGLVWRKLTRWADFSANCFKAKATAKETLQSPAKN